MFHLVAADISCRQCTCTITYLEGFACNPPVSRSVDGRYLVRQTWRPLCGLFARDNMCESRDSLLVRAPDSGSTGCGFESGQERRENFLLQSQLCVLTLIRCPFRHLVLPQWHVKDPVHSAKCTGGWLHLNTHTPLDQTKSV